MKSLRLIITILLIALALVVNTNEVSAYEFTDDAYYITIRDKNLSEITLYIPKNQVEYLSQNESGQIVNISTTTCTGYSNDIDYTISFPAFNIGRYRPTSSYDYSYLDILEIIDSNIPQFEKEMSVDKIMWQINQNETFYYVTLFIFMLGGVYLIWLKH